MWWTSIRYYTSVRPDLCIWYSGVKDKFLINFKEWHFKNSWKEAKKQAKENKIPKTRLEQCETSTS